MLLVFSFVPPCRNTDAKFGVNWMLPGESRGMVMGEGDLSREELIGDLGDARFGDAFLGDVLLGDVLLLIFENPMSPPFPFCPL
jgi:hypothetical protein